MAEGPTIQDQIRGMAMALRHWFDITETEDLIQEAGLKPPKKKRRFFLKTHDRKFEVLALTALPPQVIRLKSDAPVTTMHLLQDVYDDGELRADPWRWWFSWLSIEIIARLGPDPTGRHVKEFIVNDDSLQHVRATTARWLASNPIRVDILGREFTHWVNQAHVRAVEQKGDAIPNYGSILRQPILTLVEAMAGEAGKLSAAITARLADRVK